MTAINEKGQVYFTFEELDLEGALLECNKYRAICYKDWKNSTDLSEKHYFNEQIIKMDDVMLNIKWLIQKGRVSHG